MSSRRKKLIAWRVYENSTGICNDIGCHACVPVVESFQMDDNCHGYYFQYLYFDKIFVLEE